MKLFIKVHLYFITFCASSLNLLFAQSVFVWEDPIVVADGSIYGFTRPRIVLNQSNEPVVTFGQLGTGIIHSTKLNGSAFETPIQLTPDNFETYLSSWTGAEMAAQGDTIVVVFKQNPIQDGHIYTVRSTDGGISFSDTIRADSHGAGVAWLPNISMNENGNPSVIYMAHDSIWLNPRYVVAHSNDGGISYNSAQEVTQGIPEEACDCCPAAYTSNNNDHALLYRNNEGNIRDVYAVLSNDEGATFTTYDNIDQLLWSITSCPSTGPDAIIDQSHLFTVSASAASGKYRSYITKNDLTSFSVVDGAFMLPPPENNNGKSNYPRIHGNYDSLFVVWQTSENSNFEIFCGFGNANDFSLFEQTKSQVNIVETGNQLNPDIYYRNGHVHVVFRDGSTGNVIYRKGRLSNLGLNQTSNSYVNIYPNPCTESIRLAGNIKDNTYSIYSINGTLITRNQVYKTDNTIDVSQLTNGSYILSIGGIDLPFDVRK